MDHRQADQSVVICWLQLWKHLRGGNSALAVSRDPVAGIASKGRGRCCSLIQLRISLTLNHPPELVGLLPLMRNDREKLCE